MDSLEDPEILKNRAIQELHIQLDDGLKEEQQIFNLKEFLFGNSDFRTETELSAVRKSCADIVINSRRIDAL